MNRHRVVITGLGVIAPNGIGNENFWTALISKQSGIRRTSSYDPEVPCDVEARVNDFNFSAIMGPRRRYSEKLSTRVSQFAVACAQMALDDAGLDLETVNRRRTGLCYGTTTGKPDFGDDVLKFRDGGVDALDPTAWAEFSPHAPASHIAREFSLSGPIVTCSSGCCTGLTVVKWGADQITQGHLNTVLIGSGDSLLSPLALAALSAGKLLTRQSDPTKASRPYDLHRDGLVPGEAAGAVVLESLDSALERNARIYAEYLGYGSAVDVARANKRSALSRAIGDALDNAQLRPGQIDCINAHGLSHPIFDLEETQAYKSALGDAAYCLPVTSIKSMTGAAFSGDGILQVISSCLILEHGMIPPILHLETPDPGCDLNYVVAEPRIARVKEILTNTRGLGGANAVVILGRVDAGP